MWVPVARLQLEPDETLHVAVPSAEIGAALEELSPRVGTHLVDADAGPVTGDATQAQVWVPRSAGATLPEDGFFESLPRLQLVQLVSAGAERFVIEIFRAKDDRFLGPFTLAQLTSVVLVLIGITLVAKWRRGPSPAPGASLSGAGKSAATSSLTAT